MGGLKYEKEGWEIEASLLQLTPLENALFLLEVEAVGIVADL